MSTTVSHGKIGSLPHLTREELNRRILDGQLAPQILPWLNALPETIALINERFDGEAVTPQNLSTWRLGGYKKWLARKEKTENLKTLSSFARELVGASGNLADGAAAILSGQILETLEEAANMAVTGGSDDAEKDPVDGLAKMASAIASLQTAARAQQKIDLDRRTADRKDAELALSVQKFQRQTVEQFIKWARSPAAAEILESGKPAHVQMDLLRELMFGPVDGKGAEDGKA